MYKLTNNTSITRTADGASIPADPTNTDYLAYLAWLAGGGIPLPVDVPTLAQASAAALAQIDAEADAVYGSVLGNRAQEYTLAESSAQAYKDGGYAGTVPASVQSWATAKTWTATQAADDILATAAAWRNAQAAIRGERLLRKEQVRVATDAAGITAAMTAWAGFAAVIRAQLGL